MSVPTAAITMTALQLSASLRPHQALSPRLQHAVRLLQMSSQDFAATLRETLGRNPFLEADEDGDDGDPGADEEAAPREDASFEPPEAPDTPEADHDRDLWQADGHTAMRRADEGEASAMDRMAAEPSLAAHLHGQLNLLPLPPRDSLWARAIVESLDDDGYLRTPLDELATLAALDPPASTHDLQMALRRVQSLDPAGVAARSVGECLALQLPSIACPRLRGLAQRIVAEGLPLLAARDVGKLAAQLGAARLDVQAACDRIRRLDPRPGWRFGASRTAYVVPDVIVKKVCGQWGVQLNPAVVPKVRLNQVYAELFRRHRRADHTELADHLQDARWTLRNVEQRFATILDVASAIVQRQRHFLEFGPMAMKPLGLAEIADAVGAHESTVSRVTNNKYMATPAGVFELKHFFSRAMVSANGSACTGVAIRGLVQGMIEAERPDARLSDVDITRKLGEQGLIVARRTVTKYRQMLRIDAVDRRCRVL